MTSQPQNNNHSEEQHDTTRPDTSRRAISIARVLDRLPDGEYILVLSKNELSWLVNVNKLTQIREMRLHR